MNAHIRYTDEQRQLMREKPFAVRCPIPDDVQEDIARLMAKETAKRAMRQSVSDAEHESRAVGGQRLADLNKARSQAMLAEQSLKILPLHHEGHTVLEIHQIVGNSTVFIRKVIRKAGLQPNWKGRAPGEVKGYSHLMKRTHSLRMDGVSWVDIGQQMGVSKSRLRQAYNEWKAAK